MCRYSIAMIRPERHNSLSFNVFNNNPFNNDTAVDIQQDAHSGMDFHIFTGWLSGQEARLYKDGVLVSTAQGFPQRHDRSTSMNFIGRNCWLVNRWGDSLLTADVRQICIWQEALPEAQLAQLHADIGRRWGITMPSNAPSSTVMPRVPSCSLPGGAQTGPSAPPLPASQLQQRQPQPQSQQQRPTASAPPFPASEQQSIASKARVGLDCSICMDTLHDPVFVDTGMTYCRACITQWFARGNLTCPATGQRLHNRELRVNWMARGMLDEG